MSTGDKVRERLRQLSEALKASKEQNRQLETELLKLRQQPDQSRVDLETARQNHDLERRELEALRTEQWQRELQWERDLRQKADAAYQREKEAREAAELALEGSRSEVAGLILELQALRLELSQQQAQRAIELAEAQARSQRELAELQADWTRRYAELEARRSQEPTWEQGVLDQRIQALAELESWFEVSSLRLASSARGAQGLALRMARAERLETSQDEDSGHRSESQPTAVEGTLRAVPPKSVGPEQESSAQSESGERFSET